MDKNELMRRAIRLSSESLERGGGPFGAVIARDGEIVAEHRSKPSERMLRDEALPVFEKWRGLASRNAY